jgi:DNA repair protein RecO (recombination protein O)
MSVKDQAICIRAIDYSETSQVVTLFSQTHGKLSVLAKGSRRPKSAFGGAIEVFSYGDIVFIEPRQGTLAILTEFQIHYDVLRALSGNLFGLHGCLFVAELLNKLTQDYDSHPALYDRLLHWMRRISGCEGPRLDRTGMLALMVIFQWTLLKDIGLGLEVEACVNCGQAYSPQ